MTSHTTLRALLAPIVEREAGRITTHYETCYQWHVGCLAALVSDLLPADAEPTPAAITAEPESFLARLTMRSIVDTDNDCDGDHEGCCNLTAGRLPEGHTRLTFLVTDGSRPLFGDYRVTREVSR